MSPGSLESLPRRARHLLRTWVSERPGIYLPFARRKYPGPSPEVIGRDTRLVIDGYTRSASTFAVYALQLAQDEPIRLAHHLHAPAQLIEAARRGVPALLLIREPRGAILSQLIREPNVAMRDALVAYRRFHRRLWPYAEHFVVADFETVTNDFGSVIDRLNLRFEMSLQRFVPTDAVVRECFELIKLRGTHSRVLLGFESGLVTKAEMRAEQVALQARAELVEPRDAWVPSVEREAAKEALLAEWLRPEFAALREQAWSSYEAFHARAQSELAEVPAGATDREHS